MNFSRIHTTSNLPRQNTAVEDRTSTAASTSDRRLDHSMDVPRAAVPSSLAPPPRPGLAPFPYPFERRLRTQPPYGIGILYPGVGSGECTHQEIVHPLGSALQPPRGLDGATCRTTATAPKLPHTAACLMVVHLVRARPTVGTQAATAEVQHKIMGPLVPRRAAARSSSTLATAVIRGTGECHHLQKTMATVRRQSRCLPARQPRNSRTPVQMGGSCQKQAPVRRG